MAPDELLAAYDAQLRREAEVARAQRVEADGPLLRSVSTWGGFVTYRDLGGLEGSELDDLIARTVAWFADDTDVERFEWKTRGHDAPADLPARLLAHGLESEPMETVMIGEAEALAVDVALDPSVVLRQAGDGRDLREDIDRVHAMQESVFGVGRGPSTDDVLDEIAAGDVVLWLAEVGDDVVSAGRLQVVTGTSFGGIWGGATVPEWRGRGIYRALVAARARWAIGRGVRHIHSDCTDMSRPILERAGLVAVTTTTPYVWQRP